MKMNINKLAPWNWFKKEEELNGAMVPIQRDGDGLWPNPFVDQMRREMNRLLEDFFSGYGVAPYRNAWSPAAMGGADSWLRPHLDIASTDGEYVIKVELPGVSEKDVHVDLSGDTLRIRGEKQQENEDKNRDYYRIERSYGSFQRVLSLPEDAQADDIAATFKNGVMRITIPRKESAKTATRQIEVKTG